MRCYLDTSVIGGYFDIEFKEWTVPLFERIIGGEYTLIYSDITLKELIKAPSNVKNLIKESVPKKNKEFIESNSKSDILVKAYLEAGTLGPKSYADAEHIAVLH